MPVADFKFSVYQKVVDIVINIHSAEILFAVDAQLTVTHHSGIAVSINKGESLFIPAYV